MSIWREPRHITQRDPKDPLAMSHCWAACGAWLVDAATDGASRLTAKEFAKAAGGGTGRRTGSGTHEDVMKGLDHYGVKGSRLRLGRSDAATILGSERRAVFSVSTSYEEWPTPKDCVNGVVGDTVNHEVGVIGGKPVKAMNPLCLAGYQDITLATLLNAAFKYATEQGHSGYIDVVRVFRQKPTGAIADKARIAELEDTIAQWEEYAATVRGLAGDILDVAVPR